MIRNPFLLSFLSECSRSISITDLCQANKGGSDKESRGISRHCNGEAGPNKITGYRQAQVEDLKEIKIKPEALSEIIVG